MLNILGWLGLQGYIGLEMGAWRIWPYAQKFRQISSQHALKHGPNPAQYGNQGQTNPPFQPAIWPLYLTSNDKGFRLQLHLS